MFNDEDADNSHHVYIELNQYNVLHHRIYVFGGLILTGVAAAISAWEESHFLALLMLATFVAVPLIYELRVRRWGVGQIAVFFCLCYVLAWIAYQVVGPNLPIETDREIYLIPGNKPSPQGACDHWGAKPPNGSISFMVGSNEFWSTREGDVDIITLDDKPIITMRKAESGLLFSVDMFDLEKKLVAKIRNNRSILIPKNYSRKERSADRSSLTLYDDYDREILYIEYLNKSTVLVRGVFTGPGGTTITVDDNEISIGTRYIGGACNGNVPGIRVSGNRVRD